MHYKSSEFFIELDLLYNDKKCLLAKYIIISFLHIYGKTTVL